MIEHTRKHELPMVPLTNQQRLARWIQAFNLYARCIHANHTAH